MNAQVLRNYSFRFSKTITLLALVLSWATPRTQAHQGAPPLSTKQQALNLAAIQQMVLPPTDVQAELNTDTASEKPAPLRFAVSRRVEISPATHGTWEDVAGGRLWRLRLLSAGATDMNLGFTSFWMPEGAAFYIISETEGYYQGPYTSEHNADHGQLWTPVVPGDGIVLEMFVPAGAAKQPSLVLRQVGTGYRDMFHRQKDLSLAKAGSCEIDAVCPAAAAWSNEVRSAACISIGGTLLCSATLIMDAAGDFRPFLLTANHCGVNPNNAATLVAYWNYKSPTCGSYGAGGSLSQNTSGSTFRAAKADVDFCLVELSTTPNSSYAVYYAGWDHSGVPPSSAVGIHHPNVEGTCVSFSSGPFYTMSSCILSTTGATHWQVPWGSMGVTEPGSSGSGIWDGVNRFVIGTLSGGPSSCTAAPGDKWDCYGKVSVAWDSGRSPSERLWDWLDPGQLGLVNKAGAYAVARPRLTVVGLTLTSEGCQPTNGVIDPGETVTMTLKLRNDGTTSTANLVATLLPSANILSPSAPQSFGAMAPGAAAISRTFTFTANGNCADAVSAVIQFSDNGDPLGGVTYSTVLGKPVIGFSQNFDTVTAPALPANWVSSPAGFWATRTTSADTAPNAVYTGEPASITNKTLTSPSIAISSANSQLTFRHSYDTEENFDGGVLEISIAGGAFTDILTAGGSFVTGGYDGPISSNYGSPIGGRNAWTGYSGGFKTTTVTLPASATGQNIKLRWRFACDDSNGGNGWYVDTISISSGYNCCVTAARPTLGSVGFSNNQFNFTVTGTPGLAYAVETSTNLINWIRLITNTSPFTYTQTNATAFPKRLYRAVQP